MKTPIRSKLVKLRLSNYFASKNKLRMTMTTINNPVPSNRWAHPYPYTGVHNVFHQKMSCEHTSWTPIALHADRKLSTFF